MITLRYLKKYGKQLPNPLFVTAGKMWGRLPSNLRLGSCYRRLNGLLKESEKWELERIRSWQLTRLRELIRHAELTVPWYRNTFKTLGMTWQDIRDLKDVEEIPIISKLEISERFEEFVSDRIDKRKLSKSVTGGSTGAPLSFYLDPTYASVEAAALNNVLQRFGCRCGDRFLVVRTQRGDLKAKKPYWTYNPHRNQLVINSYLMSKASMPEIANRVREFKPKYVLAIPSMAALFCKYLMEAGENIDPWPRVVILSSENSYREQRKLISEAFKCQTIMQYGQTEGVAMAFEDQQYGNYHVNPFYGLVEIINRDGKPTDRTGEKGEIIGTSFYNFVMPFIRYRTGDIATIADGKSLWSVKEGIWERIDGRTVELIQTRDSRWIMVAALLFGTHDDTFSNVVSLQLEQKEAGKLIFRVIRGREFSSVDEKKIREMIANLTQNGFELSFEYVESIQRTERGKQKLIIQHLELPDRVAS
jgi:phenylacetate-CoA ligase